MGDFDKVQAAAEAPNDQKRKQILVGVLGAVLLGVVGFHFLKGSPERVHGGIMPVAADGGVVAATETPKQAIAGLEADPTRELLKAPAVLERELQDVPHDPFAISKKLQAQFSKAPEKVVPQVVHVDPTPVSILPRSEAPTIGTNALKVEMIIRMSGSKNAAIINGNIVSEGQTVGDALVVEVAQDRVVVRHKDYPEGKTTTLAIQPKIK